MPRHQVAVRRVGGGGDVCGRSVIGQSSVVIPFEITGLEGTHQVSSW